MAKKSKVILSYSPQGGTGKSTMAINAALIFATKGFKTLLVDMSLYGSVISTLKIRQKSGQGLSAVINTLELSTSESEGANENAIETTKSAITKGVGTSGLDVLVSANPIKMEGLNENSTIEIVEVLRQLDYDLVIVDTSPELSIKNLVLIDKVDYILLTAIQDVSCGWKMLMFKEIAQRFSLPSEKFGVVINRVSKFNGFNNKEFEQELGYRILSEFPEYSKEMQAAVNKGDLVTSKYNKKVYASFEEMAKSIHDELGRLFKKAKS